MGRESTTTTQEQQSTQTQQATETADEKELNRLALEKARAAQPGQLQVQESGLNLINQLLTGQQLPGFLSDVSGGIGGEGLQLAQQEAIPESLGIIGAEQTSALTSEALRNITPSFQRSGILDSGVRAAVSGRVAGDISRNVAEGNIGRQLAIRESNLERERAINQFNVSNEFQRQGFNIGNLLNLLNLGVGGQAQIQQPLLQQSGQLSSSLAGLRSFSGTSQSTGSQTVTSPNPFLQSFQQSLGQNLGNPSFEKGLFTFGGG